MTSNWAKNHWIKWKLKKHNKCQEQDSWQVSEQNNKPHWIEWKLTKTLLTSYWAKLKNLVEFNEKKTDKHNKCQEQDSWQVSEQYNKTHWIKWTRKQTSNRAK